MGATGDCGGGPTLHLPGPGLLGPPLKAQLGAFCLGQDQVSLGCVLTAAGQISVTIYFEYRLQGSCEPSILTNYSVSVGWVVEIIKSLLIIAL